MNSREGEREWGAAQGKPLTGKKFGMSTFEEENEKIEKGDRAATARTSLGRKLRTGCSEIRCS